MSAPCKKIYLPLAIAMMAGMSSLQAAALRWIHLGTHEAGLAGLAINGKVAYRKMPPGKITPWGDIPSGVQRFQIVSEKNPGSAFELTVADKQRITLVSVSDKDGNLECRTYGLDEPQGEIFVLNMLNRKMLEATGTEEKAVFGKGIWLPDLKVKNTISLTDAEGFKAEVDFTRNGEAQPDPFFAIFSENDDGIPGLAILRDSDSLFEMTDESIEIPGKLTAGIRVISMGNVPAPGSFDPTGVNWETVESQIFWLNLLIDRDPCRLEISGFPAIRRMPSGRGSGFVKWPAGAWRTDIVAERTNTKLATDGFSLSAKGNIGLISSGGGKFSHRLLTLEGRPPVKSEAPMATRIRFANALPDGVVGSTIPFNPEPVLLTLKPGECSEIFQPEKGRFPGAALNLTIGNLKNKVITKIPAMPSLPQGDWVVIIHLNQESFDAPVITWVEMDKGMIIEPSKQGGEE